MLRIVLVGIGAGVAAALLFLAPIGGSPLAFPLFVLTGLPIAIAGLGWGMVAGILAVASGAAIVGLTVGTFVVAAMFVLVFAAPVAWVTRLAGLSRPADPGDPKSSAEWYPLGRILMHAALAVAIGLVLTGFVTGYDPAVVMAQATEIVLAFLADPQAPGQVATAESVRPMVSLYVAILPFTLGTFMLAVVVFNVWLGGIVARASGKLARPPERLWTVAPPVDVVVGFAVVIVLAFLLPGPLGEVAAVFAGAFGGALALVGLAVLHAVTLGIAGRSILLVASYALILISGLPVVLLVALGAAENFLHLRARRFGAAPPT